MAGPSEDYQSSLGNDDIKDQEDAHESSNPVDKEQDIEGDPMAHLAGNSIHRSSSRPQLDLSKAAIQGTFEERDPTILLPNQSDDISHLALDIGGIEQDSGFFGSQFFQTVLVFFLLPHFFALLSFNLCSRILMDCITLFFVGKCKL